MPQWQLPPEPNIPPELLAFTGDPLLAQLLTQRGLITVAQAQAFLDPQQYQPAPASDLPDIDQAVERLNQAIAKQERICVWGDFDVDGQTSTALLFSLLQDLGAQVQYYIPNRLTESHGIKMPALQRLLDEGVELLLTCDTGIAEFEAVEVAHQAGAEVIITDHHDLADTLPPAYAVVNPKRLPPDHPLRELPGVGVAYKLAQALYQDQGRPTAADDLLDLVALGIVADVARQTKDTRYLLQQGLIVLQQTPRPGLHALIENANLKTDHLTEEHISFWLAPRLNALGRLGDANLAVELLTTDSLSRARIIALQLEALNDRRKMLVDRVTIQAISLLEETPSLVEYNAIVLAAADWHVGVIGIAANRLSDRYGKPTILISHRPDGLGRGSARSVVGCDIHQALKSQAELLVSFGGHPMAAGLAIRPEHLIDFRRGLSAALESCQEVSKKTVKLDVMIELSQANVDLLHTIQRLAPFGAGNPAVRLGCVGLAIINDSTFGKARNHKRLTVADETGMQQEVIWWGGAIESQPQGQFDLAFTLKANTYKGPDAVQLEWVAARDWQPTPVITNQTFIDWRYEPNPQALLTKLQSPSIWAEGVTVPGQAVLRRHQLQPANTFVIWTAPPDHNLFQQAVNAVIPQQIYVVGQPLALDTFPAFVQQLMGSIKYALTHKEGEIVVDELAAALGHRAKTTRLGIDWLIAQGRLSLYVEEDDILVVRLAQNTPNTIASTLETVLKEILTETAAYRRFFREATLASLQKVFEIKK